MSEMAFATEETGLEPQLWRAVAADAALLILCLRGVRLDIPADVDWSALHALAEENGVLLPVYDRLLELGVQVPYFLGLPALAARAAAEAMAAQLEELLRAFEACGIEAIPLKGPALALGLYGDAAMRQSNDLDLLVRHRDFSKAEMLLVSGGFSALGPAGDHDRRFLRGNLLVELHFELASPRFFPFRTTAVWSRSMPASFRGRPARSMGRNDLALYLCAHGLKHGFSRLIWILDLARSLEGWRADEYRELLGQAQREGLLAWLLIGCEVVRTMFPERMPEQLDREIAAFPAALDRARRAARRLFPEDASAEIPDFRSLYLEAEANPMARWLYRLRYLAPTGADEAWAGRHRVHPRLMFLLRPVRLMDKYGLAQVWRILFPSGV